MAHMDHIHAEIGWLKVLFPVAVALAASVIGWIAQRYDVAAPLLIAAACLAALLFVATAISAMRRIYSLINDLEAT